MNYLMPFLIIIAIGVIGVLLVNLIQALFGEGNDTDALMHISSGTVEMRTWGTDEYVDLSSDAVVIEGDEIKTSADGKVIIEFFDGTIMRVDGGTNLLFQTMDEGDPAEIELLLISGKVWFNKLYRDSGDTKIVVLTDNLAVTSSVGSIFEIENDMEEAIRVINGKSGGETVVDILTEEEKIVETEKIGVGQEIVFNEKVLDRYWQYQSPSVLSALSDSFRESEWYLWNIEEDTSPTILSKSAVTGEVEEYVEVEPEVIEPTEEDVPEDPEAVSDSEEGEPEVESTIVVSLAKPSLTSVAGLTETNEAGFYVVTSHLATLTGGVSGASQVMVNDYILQQFQSGGTSWTYYANADYYLMEEGENIYQVYAVAENGDKSEPLTVKVLYNPPAPVVEEPPAEEAPAEEVPVEDVPTADPVD